MDWSTLAKLGRSFSTGYTTALKKFLNRSLLFWATLLALLLGTILNWQFRFQETGTAFWRGGSTSSWAQEPPVSGITLPTWENGQYLNFSPGEKSRAGTRKSWPVDGAESIKVRVVHRAPAGLHQASSKKYPIEVVVVPYDSGDHILLQHMSLIAFTDPGAKWNITEAVAPIPMEAKRVMISLIANQGVGDYQISSLNIVEVKSTKWFTFFSIVLLALWTGWILWAVRRQRGEQGWIRISSLFATIWIIGWGVLLVFPRTVDIPRPFFSTFYAHPKPVTALVPGFQLPPNSQVTKPTSSASTAPEHANWSNRILSWFKNHRGGRFILHLGVMGLFSGMLLLVMKPGQAYPFILAMAVGVELVPWIWLGNFDRDDVSDILAYGIAFAFAVPISSRLRR